MVGGYIDIVVGIVIKGYSVHRVFYHVGNLEETATSVKESTIGYLVSGIEYAWHIAAFLYSLKSQGKTPELIQVGLEELQRWRNRSRRSDDRESRFGNERAY